MREATNAVLVIALVIAVVMALAGWVIQSAGEYG